MQTLLHWFCFVVVGMVTAAIGELQFSVFLRGDWANWIGSLVVNALFCTGLWLLYRLLFRPLAGRRWQLATYVLVTGVAGLAMEWFAIGNSPWGNPDASQVAMFAYWASMALAPVVVLEGAPRLRRQLLAVALVYLGLAFAVQMVENVDIHWVWHIWSVIIGYVLLLGWLVRVLWREPLFIRSVAPSNPA